MNEDSQRVWVQAPEEEVEGEGPVSFPTIVLSAKELKLVKRCAEGREDVDQMLGSGDFGREMETVEESISTSAVSAKCPSEQPSFQKQTMSAATTTVTDPKYAFQASWPGSATRAAQVKAMATGKPLKVVILT